MPNIKPISDLRSYSAVPDEVTQGSPVFLTNNGRGRYVTKGIADHNRQQAERTPLAQLDNGSHVADEQGVLTTDQVRGILSER